MSPFSDIYRRQTCTKPVVLEYLLHAVSVADASWGDMLEPACNRIYCCKYTTRYLIEGTYTVCSFP